MGKSIWHSSRTAGIGTILERSLIGGHLSTDCEVNRSREQHMRSRSLYTHHRHQNTEHMAWLIPHFLTWVLVLSSLFIVPSIGCNDSKPAQSAVESSQSKTSPVAPTAATPIQRGIAQPGSSTTTAGTPSANTGPQPHAGPANGAASRRPEKLPAVALTPEQQIEQTAAIAAIEKLGGTVRENPGGFYAVTMASNKNVTDDAMRYVAKIPNVSILSLDASPVGDEGIQHLRGLKGLRILWMRDTRVTDAGLAYLVGFPQLEWVTLGQTKVTDNGLKHLQNIPLTNLGLNRTAITDAGLEYLKAMPYLTSVWLDGSKVTEQGVKALQQQRPDLRIKWTPPPPPGAAR